MTIVFQTLVNRAANAIHCGAVADEQLVALLFFLPNASFCVDFNLSTATDHSSNWAAR